MVFHEITREAIRAPSTTARTLTPASGAQETRRISTPLRLRGQPRAVAQGAPSLPQDGSNRWDTPAGRARARSHALPGRSYWTSRALPAAARVRCHARGLDGARWRRTGFGDDGQLSRADVVRLDETGARGLADGCRRPSSPYGVSTKNPGGALPMPVLTHAPTGGRAQAALFRCPTMRVARISMRPGTSPTCVPTARRCPTSPDGRPRRRARPVRGDYLPAAPAVREAVKNVRRRTSHSPAVTSSATLSAAG